MSLYWYIAWFVFYWTLYGVWVVLMLTIRPCRSNLITIGGVAILAVLCCCAAWPVMAWLLFVQDDQNIPEFLFRGQQRPDPTPDPPPAPAAAPGGGPGPVGAIPMPPAGGGDPDPDPPTTPPPDPFAADDDIVDAILVDDDDD